MHYHKSTLPMACRNFVYPYWQQKATNLSLVQKYGPLYMGGTLHTSISLPKGTPLLSPPTPKLDGLVNDLETKPREAILVTPQWEDAGWYARALRLSVDHHIVLPDSRNNDATTWARVAFRLTKPCSPNNQSPSDPQTPTQSMPTMQKPTGIQNKQESNKQDKSQ